MKSVFLFLPFLIVASIGIYQDSFAENVETGSNYFKTYNPDGTITMTSHAPYTFDGNNWVPYISSGTQVQTHMGVVTLNGSGYFKWNGKFSDFITAKYADISDLNIWTYPNTLNNDAPDISWDGSQLTAEKNKAGVGNLKYKYIYDNGEWKTQLEATNLSSLNTKVFGFDQSIYLNSDTIKFGGVTRNLDNFHGQIFDKEFLDANKGKVIDLLNGVNFDFDLGYENLHSIKVYDTGPNSSRLVFDYRTSEILLPGQTLIIDPTYSAATASDGRLFSTATTSVNCSATYGSTDGDYKLNLGASGGSNTCQVAYAVYDLSTIPAGSTMDSGSITYDTTAELNPVDCQFVISSTNTVGQQMYDDGRFAGAGVNATSKSATCKGVADGKVENFLSSSFSTFESKFGSTMTLLTTSMTKGVTNARDALDRNSDFRDNDAVLSITYTPMLPTEFDIEIDSAVVGDTNKITGTVTLTNGNPFPITLDSIELLKDNVQINLNNTNSTFTSIGQYVNFGPFWNRLTSGATFNFTATVTMDNATGSQVTNSSSSLTSREYDPDYFPAVDNPSIQGNVNATVERFDDDDGILLKVNRIDVSTGDTWQIECIAQTNTQASQTKNLTSSWLGTWINETNVGYFNRTYSDFADSHAYITCFNEDQLFSLTSYTNSSLALLGIQLFDDSYGAMLGVPVGVFFLVMTAGMANKRTAPTFIIVITGIAGTMATIGFFSFEPLVWGLALVTAMLGIFVNQKIF